MKIGNFNLNSLNSQFANTTLLVGIVILLLGFSLFRSCFVYVEPYEYGIKQNNVGFNRGIQERVYSTGFHLVVPFLSEMHKFPRNLQVFDLTNTPQSYRVKSVLPFNRKRHYQLTNTFQDKAAHIQTSDGFFVDVDVSIVFRIEDPLKVIKTVGTGDLYVSNGLIPKAEPILKETLGTLTTEEFYNPHLRVEKMKSAEERLNKDLAEKGIAIEHVLIRYFRYSNEIFEFL